MQLNIKLSFLSLRSAVHISFSLLICTMQRSHITVKDNWQRFKMALQASLHNSVRRVMSETMTMT